ACHGGCPGLERGQGAAILRIARFRTARMGQGPHRHDHALTRCGFGEGGAMSAVVTTPDLSQTGVRLGRAFWGVMLAFLVHGLIVSTWVSRIAATKRSLGLSDGLLGLTLFGAAIGSVTAIPVCGALVTRYGSRRIAIWTSIGFCVALVPLAVSRS